MKTKSKALLSSIAAIALCSSVALGGTYALFTSNSEVSIAVTSGKVNVSASVNEESLKTYSMDVLQDTGKFENGGKAGFNSKSQLELSLMSPGDEAQFEVAIANNSNIHIQYKVVVTVEGGLADVLEYTVSNASGYWTYAKAGEKIPSVAITVGLPESAGDEYQNVSDTVITVSVEAIQGNATNMTSTLDDLVSALEKGGEVTLGSDIEVTENATSIVVPEDMEATINLNGHTLKNSVAGAPALINYGTLTLTGEGGIVNGTSTQNKSHTLRNYGTLTIEEGTYGSEDTAGAALVNDGIAVINGGTFASKQEDVKADGLCAYVFINNAAGATLTINDANVKAETHGLFAAYDGELIVNGGNYEFDGNNGLGCYVVYAAAAGKVTLNSGSITAITPRNNRYFYVSNNGNKFNWAAVEAGNVVLGDDVAITVLKSDNTAFLVTKDGEQAGKSATSASDLTNAVAGETYILFKDVDLAGATLEAANLTLIGNGYTLSNANVAGTVTLSCTDVTFNNVNVTAGAAVAASTESEKTATSALVLEDNFNGKLVLEGDNTFIGGANGDGIYVPATAKLDLSGTGSLVAKGNGGVEDKTVKIGGNGIGGEGEIYIHDLASLTAEGYGWQAFGIGGNTASVTLENTTVEYVKGGYVQQNLINDTKYGKNEPEGGAAIGSSYNGAVITLKNVTIDEAEGGSKSAGIGALYHTSVTVNIENCTINKVVGGNASAGIGGARIGDTDPANQDVTINIKDSTITAYGGEYGAGIGGGYDTYCHTPESFPLTTINITGNSVINATGGRYAAGIGTGYHAGGLDGVIETTVTVNAISGEKLYKDTYTQAQDVGFGVIDPSRDGLNNTCTLNYNGEEIGVPAV